MLGGGVVVSLPDEAGQRNHLVQKHRKDFGEGNQGSGCTLDDELGIDLATFNFCLP